MNMLKVKFSSVNIYPCWEHTCELRSCKSKSGFFKMVLRHVIVHKKNHCQGIKPTWRQIRYFKNMRHIMSMYYVRSMFLSCQICVMSDLCHVRFLSCQILVMSDLCHVRFLSCQILVMSDLCHVIFVSHQICVMSVFCHVSFLSCQFFVMSDLCHIRFVSYQICVLSNFCHLNIYVSLAVVQNIFLIINKNLYKFKYFCLRIFKPFSLGSIY